MSALELSPDLFARKVCPASLMRERKMMNSHLLKIVID